MRILYTLDSGTPGGMEQHVLDLVNQMRLRGHEVFVWCRGGIIYDWYIKAGAKVVQKSIRWDFDPLYILELKRFLQAKDIDLVHAHELRAAANSLLAAAAARKKVRITHIHTPYANWQISKQKKLIYNVCYSLAVRLLATREIALTEVIKKIKTASGLPKRKLVVIPNGIDIYKFYVAENERVNYRREICKKYRLYPSAKIIGNLSRTTKEKGHDLLIRAFARLVNEQALNREEYLLLICGGGELEESLWQLAGELGIKDRIIITGQFDDDLKLKFYSTFDYFVFPTLAEGFGLVLIEALISKLPVLCSDLPVLQEVGKEFPLYFKTGDYLDLAEKLRELVQQPKDHEAQKVYVERNYSLEQFGANYQRLYESLISRPI
ncbi:glycosyltransferase family 4 protein [Patescibacteria group bacterium]|nr:glycosyltransferase family 4 protein [Patescibacteria group bacterium]